MALRNDGTRLYDFQGNELIPSVTLFKKAEIRLEEKKSLIEDLQNELNLLENQAFNLYKSHVDYLKLYPMFIDKAITWLSMKKDNKDADGNKLDRRKKYEEKDIAEYLFNKIQDYLGIDDMEVESIIDFNFGQAKDIVFTSHGHNWYLSIPIIKNIQPESYRRYGNWCFKLSLHHYDSEHCTSQIGTTFDEDELKNIMAEGIKKYCTE